ncbi:hypothetical protein GOP47_0010034 [Adiantum capillus-veneris]|uniref:Uncharacterized protein n=1 Tax=Adiantum capillus-veneris TaxID=13818 RepID=A0A9D4UXR9_ADICA|nr:hypothetical protein GOP47_0010034 [Adiantum capillus-veneris]
MQPRNCCRAPFLPRAQNRTLALCSQETVVGRPYHPVHNGQLSGILSSLQMALLAAFLCVPLQSSGIPSFQASALGPHCITLQPFNLPCLKPPPPTHGHQLFLELTPFDLVQILCSSLSNHHAFLLSTLSLNAAAPKSAGFRPRASTR